MKQTVKNISLIAAAVTLLLAIMFFMRSSYLNGGLTLSVFWLLCLAPAVNGPVIGTLLSGWTDCRLQLKRVALFKKRYPKILSDNINHLDLNFQL